jgi:4-hydroxybenzoate polyprenyltransferase
MSRRETLLAYAQLVRLPNVFTAFADIALGACAAGYLLDRPGVFVLLLLASGCLYLSGMAWNDWFDRHADARTQRFRPIPSGRVSARRAATVAMGLSAVGVVAGAAAGSGWLAVAVLTAVLAYDGWLKHTPLGPVGMGLCRFLNVLLGLSGGGPPDAAGHHLAAVVGVYIVGVTWFARTEEGDSRRGHLLAAAGVMLLSLALALCLPLHREPGTTFVGFSYLLVAFGFHTGIPLAAAVREPSAKRVQAGVKACVLGLVLLDAVLATVFVGPAGLLIGLLLVPARLLGRRVYST